MHTTTVGVPGTIAGLHWALTAAILIPLLMFIALAWRGYERTLEQAQKALLETSRVLYEYAGTVWRSGGVSLDADGRLDTTSAARLADLHSSMSRGSDLRISFVTTSGETLFGHPSQRDDAHPLDPNPLVTRAIAGGATHGVVDDDASKTGYRLAAFRQLVPFPVVLVVSRKSSSVLEEWRHDVATLSVFLVPMWLALVLAVLVALRRAKREHAALVQSREETERRTRAEEQLRQFQKYEALAELTGGAAVGAKYGLRHPHHPAVSGRCMPLAPRRGDLLTGTNPGGPALLDDFVDLVFCVVHVALTDRSGSRFAVPCGHEERAAFRQMSPFLARDGGVFGPGGAPDGRFPLAVDPRLSRSGLHIRLTNDLNLLSA